MKKRTVILALVAAALWSCGGEEGQETADAQAADTMTTAERDSAMAELPIPGISGIRDARKAAEKAQERADLLDSIGG